MLVLWVRFNENRAAARGSQAKDPGTGREDQQGTYASYRCFLYYVQRCVHRRILYPVI
jgi:hypothetical protein